MGCFRRKRKKFKCTVVLLDETDIFQEIESSARGEALLEKVYSHLNLLENAYFGLRYLNKSGESRWLDPLKKVFKQLKGLSPFTLYFGVKFYASDPCKLLEEITRYQFVLQLKQDILKGRLPLSSHLAAELFALSLQAELGDYDPKKHHPMYVSEFRFLPEQSAALEATVEKIHKTLGGRVPSDVEMMFLERVKWLDLYGVDLHSVLGDDHVEYFLGLTPSGVIVMKNKKTMSHYFWPRISKVFFKGKYFLIRVRDKTNEEMTYGFLLSSKEACEYLWRCCVEHHAFFRLIQVRDISENPMQIFRLGSKYRFSGRTEQQIREDARRMRRPPPPIVRVPSRRFQKRLEPPDGADAQVLAMDSLQKKLPFLTKDDLILAQNTCPPPLHRCMSTPVVLPEAQQPNGAMDLPPWEDPDRRGGLFSSRTSLASSVQSGSRRRSSSVDSNDSRRRRRHHRSRRSSDNESDISKSSKDSRNRGSGRKSRSRDSGSESEHRRRKHGSRNYQLVDSETQWRRIQQREQQTFLQNAVVRDLSNRKSGYTNSGNDSESEATVRHRKKHRRHSRSRSRSPESLPQEVKKHLEYRMIDPAHLTEEEKRHIQYTRVESDSSVFRIRYSPSSGRPHRRKIHSSDSMDAIRKESPLTESQDSFSKHSGRRKR